MPADYSKVHRLLRLLMRMQQGHAGNATSLAADLGVTERTIYRDLAVLSDLGVPHYFDEEAGHYRIRRDFFLPPVQLTAGEALALLALADGVGGNEQIAFTGPAAQAVEKVKGQLPARVLRELGDMDRHIDIQLPATGPAGEAISDVFAFVRQSIQQRRTLRCRYESLNAESDDADFDFRPYVLSFDQRAWYAIGHHDGRNEIRRLKLNRFTAISLTDQSYEIPENFSLDAFRGSAWRMIRGDVMHTVVIRFDHVVADTVGDTNWHPSQDIEDHPDGSITFRCEVAGLDEIVWWVLGYGPHAQVQEPEELAQRVASLAQQTVARYT